MPNKLYQNMATLHSLIDWGKFCGQDISFPNTTQFKNGNTEFIPTQFKRIPVTSLVGESLLEKNLSKIVRIYAVSDMFFEHSIAGILYDGKNKVAIEIQAGKKVKSSEYTFINEKIMLSLFDNNRAREKFFPHVKQILYKREQELNFDYFAKKLIG